MSLVQRSPPKTAGLSSAPPPCRETQMMVIPSKRYTNNSNVLPQPKILIADRGCRGEKDFVKTPFLTPSLPSFADTEYKKRKQRKRFRKRAGIEATISHLKHEFRLGRRFLKGEIRDRISVSLSTVA